MERINVLDGKQVGELLAKATLKGKDAGAKGVSLFKAVFSLGKQYVADVTKSYKETVGIKPPRVQPPLDDFRRALAKRVIAGETFEVTAPNGRKIKVVKGVIQPCEEL